MDYIHSLIVMEDDLDENNDLGEFSTEEPATQGPSDLENQEPEDDPMVDSADWCVCGKCRPMPQEIENKCCNLRKCITLSSRFTKLCLDPDVLELCIRNTSDIRNDREDNSTRAFRKAAYRQFILARHGHLGKGNRRVCPSCVVLKIRERFPSVTGVYMGYKEH
ncbi:P2X purinoceptor 7-like [Dendronephthya gigantea]|uniref:P2X purinoceptor 7-like n=1 Tax=Dendronephthya gigantea TaxID=151771 RepID=UPI00106CF7EC|nr:P2X purinoceptor 7-like [Dendronephthya gigantea]